MELSVRSWSRPENAGQLIGIKKVDLSVFEYGIHIPIQFHNIFEAANDGVHIERGHSKDVKLEIDDNIFDARLTNIKRTNLDADTLQLRYDNNDDIKEFLKNKFSLTYRITNSKARISKNVSPDLLSKSAEFMKFYQTEKPFEYKVELIESELTESEIEELLIVTDLPEPLDKIFKTRSDAEWAFEYIEKILGFLGVKDANDPRVAITMPHKGRVLRLNYGNWAVLQFYGPEYSIYDVGIAFFDAKFNFSDDFEKWDPFKNSDPSISVYELSMKILQSTFENISKRFSNWKVSNLRSYNISEITEAIFDPDKMTSLLTEGIPTVKIPSYWVFQGNPKIFNVIKSLENNNLTTWSVSAHKKRIKKGDKFFLWITGPKSGCYALGTITSDVYRGYDNQDEEQYYLNHDDNVEKDRCDLAIDISLIDDPIFRSEVKANPKLQNLKIGYQGTNFSATEDEFEELLQIVFDRGLIDPPPKVINEKISLEQISDITGIDKTELQRWTEAIDRKNQAIIYGPPGTGKTFIANHIAKYTIGGGDGFYELVQFHPTYSYEDFIQGLRPQVNLNGQLEYAMIPGRFIDFCEKAEDCLGTCVLIIDEINRANLSRVFGELMYLLEYRDQKIPIASGGELRIPENIKIIGTMNTADRSIALVDHALRRRFAFLSLKPNYEILKSYHEKTGFDVNGLIDTLRKLNIQIADPHYEVGITFFLLEDLFDQIEDVWRMEIEPYLEEYFFDQPEKVEEFRWQNVNRKII
jgi:hypothetical protein